MTPREIWGFRIEVDDAGKTRWPVELKSEAVRRLREGAQLAVIAKELGTHPALVRKWLIKDRRANGGWLETPVPFAELRVDDKSLSEPAPAHQIVDTTCRLEVEGMSLAFSSNIPAEDLARIIDVLRGTP